MALTIILVIVVVIAAVLVFASTRPDTFRVERSTTIKAPPSMIFDAINDFHRWAEWSPWENIDPGLKRTYSGAPSGVGTVYEWTGNSKVGTGRMEITAATAPSKIVVKLDFLKPMEAHNTAEFTIQPEADCVRVTWAMFGPATFMGKLMTLFISMDRMVGGSFEQGLANLKRVGEAGSRPA